jgi:acetylornithine deacetylase
MARATSERVDVASGLNLLLQMVDIPSPTGFEADMAEFMLEQYEALGMRSIRQELSPGRFNAVGILPGSGGGPTLMLNGHMDTSYRGDEEYLSGSGYKPKGIREGDWLYGLGVKNMKCGLAAFLAAVRAIVDSGIERRGDIVVAAVVGEVEKAPVDEFQGVEYSGYGVGTKHLVAHGQVADYCILGEPTGLQLGVGHMGSTWVKITTRGTVSHTGYIHKSQPVSAIDKAVKIYQAIKEWIPSYQERHEYLGERPNVNIASMRGGWPWRAARNPIECSLYLDVRTLHDQSSMDVRRELEELIGDLRATDENIEAEVELYVTNPGVALDPSSTVATVVSAAHEMLTGAPPAHVYKHTGHDATHLEGGGITTIVYGPGGRTQGGGVWGWSKDIGEHLHVDEFATCARVYSAAAVEICGQGSGKD